MKEEPLKELLTGTVSLREKSVLPDTDSISEHVYRQPAAQATTKCNGRHLPAGGPTDLASTPQLST
jgi:hypothetical protein